MSEHQEFERYLQGQSTLSQVYAELPGIEPPAYLDAPLLAEAHRAVGARPGAARKRRWVMPLSMVASLFIAVLIGLQLPYLLREASAPRTVSEMGRPEARLDRAAPVAPAAQAPGLEAYSAREIAEPRSAANQADRLQPQAAKAAAPAPAAEPMRSNKPALESTAQGLGEVLPLKKEREGASAEGSSGDRLEAAAPQRVAPAVRRQAKQDEATPEEWLARIRHLEKDGRMEEARRELAAFRKRYPQHHVPAEINLE